VNRSITFSSTPHVIGLTNPSGGGGEKAARRTLVQGHWPARTLCEECAKLEQKLNPSRGPKPKQPAASVAVRQGVDAALPRAPSGGILEPRSDCERSSADRSRPVFRNDP